jgi:hypothetical protein
MPINLVRLIALERRQHQRIISLQRSPAGLVLTKPLNPGIDTERLDLFPQLLERLRTHADIMRMGV